jgi:hypothetical protein
MTVTNAADHNRGHDQAAAALALALIWKEHAT